MSELVPAPAPNPPPGMTNSAVSPASSSDGDGNEISVLLAAKRLQITAHVDACPTKMLAKYKEILKMQ